MQTLNNKKHLKKQNPFLLFLLGYNKFVWPHRHI